MAANPLGEICLLAFTHAQTGLNGLGAIALMGTFRIGRALPGQPVRQAAREGRRRGLAAKWLPETDWEPLMREDLGEVSKKLGLEAPAAYRGVIHTLRPATA